MEPLREQSTVRIGHLTGTSTTFGFIWIGEERRYDLTGFQVRRPATGEKIVELRCDSCGAELLLRVRSSALSRAIRKRRMVTTLVSLALAVVLIGGAIGLDEAGITIPLSTAFGVVLLVVSLLTLAVFGIACYAWTHEEGLRLYSPTGQGDRTHRLLVGAGPHDAQAP
ncbi:hypothetical protein [Glycomyces algeriensis]|jgi:hypothetical protein|uniref:Uncharacterized protein n=1 Tax=Glycomyces algeriensis TaxID=256037 RepID=A0A9W6GAU0_9ACTN|nr:hypothetical protein [Glycomyces algeriensis]MDA1364637.1 hypothetical protein [Glycomyces algeriensis]MDR7350674.1 hypothetical protein [Glycomyces algeriensis]GLI43383.1 hypothetical protein GALLR39Z86_32330 [Glycomyces algeriensis]